MNQVFYNKCGCDMNAEAIVHIIFKIGDLSRGRELK